MKFIAHKSFVGQVKKIEEDGSIFINEIEIPTQKGELIFTNLKGEQQIITNTQLENDFVGVKIVDKPKQQMKSPFEEQYERTFLDMNKDEYKKICFEFGSLDD